MADNNAEEFFDYSFFGKRGSPDPTPARITLVAFDDPDFAGTDTIVYYLMRGVDSGTGTYTTWTVDTTPDPNGAQATALNTNPALIGGVVFASGVVLFSWF